MNKGTMILIEAAVERARKKHPVFTTAKIPFEMILNEEVGEIAEAAIRGDIIEMNSEIMDTIAVLVRKYEGDDSSEHSATNFIKKDPETNRFTCECCDWYLEGGSPKAFGIGFCPGCGKAIESVFEVEKDYSGE